VIEHEITREQRGKDQQMPPPARWLRRGGKRRSRFCGCREISLFCLGPIFCYLASGWFCPLVS
jgi:hypothetical protein